MEEEKKLSNNALKRKYKNPTIEEDPLQFHAKPKDLSVNASDMPAEVARNTVTELIFSRSPFSSFALEPKLITLLENPLSQNGLAIKTCTTVQNVVIPTMLEKRRNMLIKSQTGSGKTLSYLVPVVNDLMQLGAAAVSRNDGSRALIIAPTRELCAQIADVLAKITQCCVWIVGGSITGGEKKKSEKARLRKGVVVLVATPGRLLDHIKTTESFNLTKLRWVVMDEADRLLDMGFEQTVLEILSLIRGENLPGLKEKNSGEPSTTGHSSGKGGVRNLQSKWSAQNAVLAKKCLYTNELVHIMASATLTKAVKQLALPIMSGAGFLVIDADAKTVDQINKPSDLMNLGRDNGRLDGSTSNKSTSVSAAGGSDVMDIEGGDGDDNHMTLHKDSTEHSNNEEGVDSDDDNDAQITGSSNKKARYALEKNEQMEAPSQLSQYYMMVNCKWRLAALLSFLRTHSHQKVVVFFSTCDSVDYHALLLREMNWPQDLDQAFENTGGTSKRTLTTDHDDQDDGGAGGQGGFTPASLSANASQYLEPLESTFTGVFGKECTMYRLHGNVPQKVRQTVYKDFCNARSGILLCTDVAARGLDLPSVDWILQYDPPCETTDYVHRIGRTARKGLVGSALLFLLPSEASYITLLGSHGLVPEALSLQSLFLDASKHIKGAATFKNSEEMGAVILQRRAETVVYNNKWLLSAGRQAFRSFVRAYATHSLDTKGIFKVQSLHLGHVAKTFGLRESPKALRNNDDVIGKIFNGVFSAKSAAAMAALTSKEKAAVRDSKYGLGNKTKNGTAAKGSKNHGERGTINSSSSGGNNSTGSSNALVPTPGFLTAHLKKGNDRQKLRKMGSTGASSGGNSSVGIRSNVSKANGEMKPSGKFRKTTGYFRKKLRAQLTSEFSN